MTMYLSGKGLQFIKGQEDFRDRAYLCEAGVWTIGYGTTRGVKKGDTITLEEAEKRLLDDVAQFERCVNKSIKVKLTQGQFDSLVSFCYNVGCGNFEASTLVGVLNMGKYEQVPEQLRRWNKVKKDGVRVVSKGLVNRRDAEVVLWNS